MAYEYDIVINGKSNPLFATSPRRAINQILRTRFADQVKHQYRWGIEWRDKQIAASEELTIVCRRVR